MSATQSHEVKVIDDHATGRVRCEVCGELAYRSPYRGWLHESQLMDEKREIMGQESDIEEGSEFDGPIVVRGGGR